MCKWWSRPHEELTNSVSRSRSLQFCDFLRVHGGFRSGGNLRTKLLAVVGDEGGWKCANKVREQTYVYIHTIRYQPPSFTDTQMSAIFHIRQANQKDVVCIISERIFIYILNFFWGQDIILQLIMDLVRFVVILSIEETNLPVGDIRERAGISQGYPGTCVCQLKCICQVLSIGVLASQKSIRNPLRTCTARIYRNQWSCWWTNWLGPVFLQFFHMDR